MNSSRTNRLFIIRRKHVRWLAAPILILLLLAASPAAIAAPPVHLELVTGQGFPITGGQKWLESLGRVGFASLKIRAGEHSIFIG